MPKVQNYQKAIEKQERKQRLRKSKKNLRPNAVKRGPRQKGWDHMADDDWDAPGFYENERVMPRGTQSRHKEVEEMARQSIKQAGEEVDTAEQDLPPGTQQGEVVEASGEHCVVLVEGKQIDCAVRRSLLVNETTFTTVVAAGDMVAVRVNGTGEGVVEKVLPRRSLLARPFRPNKGGTSSFRQIVAANVDQVLIVASWRLPSIWPELIDRYLIAAERNQLKAVICINKIDLVEDEAELEVTLQPYREAGYQVILTSAETGVGIDERGKNRNQGRHTTTMATLYSLNGNGAVIDTPGIREFGLAFLERHELASFYPEIARAAAECQYADCTHTHEPNCAVKAAVDQGEVSLLRYENYQKIMCTL
jgi:ribosome biogenesis GTPase